MTVLLTGAAGFIGYHVAEALLARGQSVVGIDNLNDYYDVGLKQARLKRLKARSGFVFRKLDFADRDGMATLGAAFPDVTHILHLGAQPGVRYSLVNPYAYVTSNVMGQVTVLELARALKNLRNVVYASSSSVYGGNEKLPFAVGDAVETPQSLYAATKRADELISHTYAHLYGIPLVGLRFFTVYGPWGRPDMAPMIFARAILAGEAIAVFNNGEMWRDFTYVDDIVSGVLAAMEAPPAGKPPHKLYNIGNSRCEKLTDFIAALEAALGRKAEIRFEPMQPGDVEKTYADIEATRRELGFSPTTPIGVGVSKFVAWYRDYYRV
ncbi:MAG: NAD-dependent epimerase/dehydratase family protein [Alphaproteobacteria bacterium]|nr:NAD-dependent epimerase/dehydratase family protein [Alphaproteobacteria bacterium]MDE2631207.1 NAD-dependent epimerase/dehydratase family protein [Alphaproteobacteria bacterium]